MDPVLGECEVLVVLVREAEGEVTGLETKLTTVGTEPGETGTREAEGEVVVAVVVALEFEVRVAGSEFEGEVILGTAALGESGLISILLFQFEMLATGEEVSMLLIRGEDGTTG